LDQAEKGEKGYLVGEGFCSFCGEQIGRQIKCPKCGIDIEDPDTVEDQSKGVLCTTCDTELEDGKCPGCASLKHT
jgi:hypothetical protein